MPRCLAPYISNRLRHVGALWILHPASTIDRPLLQAANFVCSSFALVRLFLSPFKFLLVRPRNLNIRMCPSTPCIPSYLLSTEAILLGRQAIFSLSRGSSFLSEVRCLHIGHIIIVFGWRLCRSICGLTVGHCACEFGG